MEELNEKLCMEKLDRILQRLDKLNLNDIESLKKYLLEIVLEKNPLNFEDMENLRKYLLSDILSHEQLDAFDLKVLQKMFISEKKFINDDGNANPDVCFERSNSFLDLDCYRKTNAMPPLGFTYVSRIARG